LKACLRPVVLVLLQPLQANSAFRPFGVSKCKLQLDVCDYNQWWHHLVNAYEIEGGIVLFVGKTV